MKIDVSVVHDKKMKNEVDDILREILERFGYEEGLVLLMPKDINTAHLSVSLPSKRIPLAWELLVEGFAQIVDNTGAIKGVATAKKVFLESYLVSQNDQDHGLFFYLPQEIIDMNFDKGVPVPIVSMSFPSTKLLRIMRVLQACIKNQLDKGD